jgi:hypothetical protein
MTSDATTHPRLSVERTSRFYAFRSFGLRIGVTLCDPVRPELLAPVLPPGHEPIDGREVDRHFRLEWLPGTESPIGFEGYHWLDEGEFRRFAPTPELAIEYGESVIEHHVAEFSPDYIFIHAGVVLWNGVAVILPGESRAGKSTLVRALVEAGATYFTDEYAVLDADGVVFPYPRHLSQRDGPFGPAGRIDLARHAPSGPELKTGAPVGLVVLTRFEQGAVWNAEVLSPGAAMMAMSQHVIAIRRRPAEAFAVMHRIVDTAPVVEGMRGDAADAARRIVAAVDSASADAAADRSDAVIRRLTRRTA